MNWEAVGAVGEIVGAGAVVVTLAYLALQIRQNSRNMRSQSLNAQSEQMQRVWDHQSNVEMLAALKKLYVSRETKLSFEEFALVESYVLCALTMLQNQYLHYKEGLGTDWQRFHPMLASYFVAEFIRTWWDGHGYLFFDQDFAAEVNDIIRREHPDALEYWKQYE